jgi:hypothetical protein
VVTVTGLSPRPDRDTVAPASVLPVAASVTVPVISAHEAGALAFRPTRTGCGTYGVSVIMFRSAA